MTPTGPSCDSCDAPAVIHIPVKHKGACPAAEVNLDNLSTPAAWAKPAGVIEARIALASATAESRNPRLTHLKWAKRIRELGDTLAECEAQAARLHVEHRARLLKDLRKAHTHPKFSCAAPAHLEAIDADPGLADTLKADS
jgi:hypothetical protein